MMRTAVATQRRTGPASVVVEELIPAPDSWESLRKLSRLPRLLFLDSAARHGGLGRYSFISADPFGWLWSRGNAVYWGNRRCRNVDPYSALADKLERFPTENDPNLPPFQGGAAGMFGYALCHHLERLPRPRWDEFEVPDLAVGLFDWVLAFDHAAGRAWLLATGFPETETRRRRRRAERRLREVRRRLPPAPPGPPARPAADRPQALAPAF